MFAFLSHHPGTRYGLLIDVSSASVSFAVVASAPDQPKPEVVWTHVERIIVPAAYEHEVLAKKLHAAVAQGFLTVVSQGIAALEAKYPGAKIKKTEISIGAPWCYTIHQTITKASDEAFKVTEALLNDLVDTVRKQALESIANEQLFNELGLETIRSETATVEANGYTSTSVFDQKVTSLRVGRQISFCQKRLLTVIEEAALSIDKTPRTVQPFIIRMHQYVVSNKATPTSYALIDVSGETTEIACVEGNDVYTAVTTNTGLYTLARAIATTTKSPLIEILSIMKGEETDRWNRFSTVMQVTIEEHITRYVAALTDTLKRAEQQADTVPHLYLHADSGYIDFLKTLVHQAAVKKTVHTCNYRLLEGSLTEDRVALSAFVFHIESQTD